MAALLALSTTVRNAMLDAIVTAAGSGALLRIYDGSRPATGGSATTLLAELTCSATLGTTSGGVLTFNSITADSSANATGTATWARLVTSGGTFIADMNVGTSSADVIVNTTSVVAGVSFSASSATITIGNS